MVKGWDCSSSGCLAPHKALRAAGSTSGRRGPAAGLSCPGEGSRDTPAALWQQGLLPAGDSTAMGSATQPRAQLPLPEWVILNMLPALPTTPHSRGTPSFLISILHKIDAFSPLSNTRLYESLHFSFFFFPTSTRKISSLWFLSSADNRP